MPKRTLTVLSIIVLLVGVTLLGAWTSWTISTRLSFQMTMWGTAVSWERLDPSTTKLVLVRRRFWSHAGDAVFELLPDTGPRFWFDDRSGKSVRIPQAIAHAGWFDPWGRTGDCYWLRELGPSQPAGQSSALPELRLVRQTLLGCRLP